MKKNVPTGKMVELVNEYSSLLFRTAYFYCKNRTDAEEIVQEVYIKYIKKQPSFESKQHEKAWFLRVTINLSKDYIKSFWNRNTEPYTNELSSEMDNSWMIIDMIKKLPEKYRIVIQLYYIEGYSTREIATIINRTESTVRSRLSRGRELLKEMEMF